MSGPVLVVADEANDVCEALTRGGNLPMREVVPASAVAAIAKAKPSAIVLSGWWFRLLVLTLLWTAPARAEALVADLTSHLIAITTGFTGASVVLFGAIDGPGDVAFA